MEKHGYTPQILRSQNYSAQYSLAPSHSYFSSQLKEDFIKRLRRETKFKFHDIKSLVEHEWIPDASLPTVLFTDSVKYTNLLKPKGSTTTEEVNIENIPEPYSPRASAVGMFTDLT